MKKKIPFEFVVGKLEPLNPVIKAMFGCHAIYHGEKILLIVRKKDEHTDDNGIWIATQFEHHESLKKKFPELRSIRIFGNGPTVWQNLPEESDSFESDAFELCDMILKNDPRIGKIPAKKKKKKKNS